MERFSQLKTFRKQISRYFRDYGGTKAIFGSPFFIFAIFISILSYGSFMGGSWPTTVISIIPNLLGFSLGTYAMLFSLMSGRTKLALKKLKNDAGVSYLDEVNATFFHFIFVQIITIIWAYLFQQDTIFLIINMLQQPNSMVLDIFVTLKMIGSFFGVTLFAYSLLLVIASSLAVFRIARIVDPDPT